MTIYLPIPSFKYFKEAANMHAFLTIYLLHLMPNQEKILIWRFFGKLKKKSFTGIRYSVGVPMPVNYFFLQNSLLTTSAEKCDDDVADEVDTSMARKRESMNKTKNHIKLQSILITIDEEHYETISEIVSLYKAMLLNDDDVARLCEYYGIEYSL